MTKVRDDACEHCWLCPIVFSVVTYACNRDAFAKRICQNVNCVPKVFVPVVSEHVGVKSATDSYVKIVMEHSTAVIVTMTNASLAF
jgi:hypothetical protein